jgi:hypothetical protein
MRMWGCGCGDVGVRMWGCGSQRAEAVEGMPGPHARAAFEGGMHGRGWWRAGAGHRAGGWHLVHRAAELPPWPWPWQALLPGGMAWGGAAAWCRQLSSRTSQGLRCVLLVHAVQLVHEVLLVHVAHPCNTQATGGYGRSPLHVWYSWCMWYCWCRARRAMVNLPCMRYCWAHGTVACLPQAHAARWAAPAWTGSNSSSMGRIKTARRPFSGGSVATAAARQTPLAAFGTAAGTRPV